MFAPLRLVLEADAPELRAGKECAQLLGRMVDGEGRELVACFFARACPRRHATNFATSSPVISVIELVLAKKLN